MIEFVDLMPLLTYRGVDCNELMRMYVPIMDTHWVTFWDRRDVFLVWMGLWGSCTRWGLVPYCSCCCFIVNM